jgi:hypothetical protein
LYDQWEVTLNIYKSWENYPQINCPFHGSCQTEFHFACHVVRAIKTYYIRIISRMYKRYIKHERRTILPALKGNNSCKAYNFRIKVGTVQVWFTARMSFLTCWWRKHLYLQHEVLYTIVIILSLISYLLLEHVQVLDIFHFVRLLVKIKNKIMQYNIFCLIYSLVHIYPERLFYFLCKNYTFQNPGK